MIIDCISDTHGRHGELDLPGGDLLIHAGDCSHDGEIDEVLEFLTWFEAQNYTYRLLVPGNHDTVFDLIPEHLDEECKKRGITLLNDSGCIIEGIKIWGSPIFPTASDRAFHRERGEDIRKHWDLIPKDTELLITHGPPYGILDEILGKNYGCEDLHETILQTKIILHIFGHIHMARGHTTQGGRLYVNASSLGGTDQIEGFRRVLKTLNQYKLPEAKI